MSLRRAKGPAGVDLGHDQSVHDDVQHRKKQHTFLWRLTVGIISAGILLFTLGHESLLQGDQQVLEEQLVPCRQNITDNHGSSAVNPPYTKILQDLLASRQKKDGKTTTYSCPCCGWQGNEFMAHKKTKNRKCPICRSFGRHRRVCAVLGAGQRGKGDWFKVPQQTGTPFRLVSFGPHQHMERSLNFIEGIDQVSLDYLVEEYRHTYSNNVMHADVTEIPLPTSFANGVIILHVLEHVPDTQRALSELKRIMKGWMLVEVPCRKKNGQHKDCRGNMTKEERIECAGQWDHVWAHDCDAFGEDLKNAGLDCYKIESKDFGEFEPIMPSCHCLYEMPLYACTAGTTNEV